MDETETKIWVHLTLYGGTALVVLGAGLYALIEEKFVPGVLLTVGGIGGVGDAGRRALGRGLTVPNWVLLIVLVLTWVFFGYDIYDHQHHTQSQISALPSSHIDLFRYWSGGTPGVCTAIVDGTQLMRWQSGYRVALVCGVRDPTIDQLDSKQISVSNLFSIGPNSINIAVSYSSEMASGIKQAVDPIFKSDPQTFAAYNQLWYRTILLPNGTSSTDIRRLSDVRHYGGLILDQEARVPVIIPRTNSK
jgi:hypothetical protein